MCPGRLKRVLINDAILVLSAIVVLFHIFLVYYIVPMVLNISRQTDPEARDAMLEALVINTPFIITLSIAILSILILPLAFFLKNRGITNRKWLLVIGTLLGV